MTYIELRARCEGQMALEVCDGCTACWLRCADGVQATWDEWKAVQEHIASMGSAERSILDRVSTQPRTVDLGDEVTVTMCRYFDRESLGCAVYPARPLVCRLLGHVEWLPCPIEKVPNGVPTPDALALMRAYARFERRTFAEWEVADHTEERLG